MTQMPVNHNPTQNPDPQKDGTSGDDITHPQEQQPLPDRLPLSLIQWLARAVAPAAGAGVKRRYSRSTRKRRTDWRVVPTTGQKAARVQLLQSPTWVMPQ